MSKCLKSAIEGVKYNICCLEDECDNLHYEVYDCYRRNKLFEYQLTLEELDNQYDELERLEKKYKIELSKERYKRAHENSERTFKTLTSQLQRLIHLENVKIVKHDEIAMEIEHVEDTNTEDPIEEVKQVDDRTSTPPRVAKQDPIEVVKQAEDLEVACEDHVEETKSQPDCFQIVEEYKVVGDVIEVDHIEFVIPEYSIGPPSLASQFSEFFTPQSFFKNSIKIFFVPVPSCMVLAFYKTRGRVFSNKGRMMGNGSEEFIYMLLISIYIFSIEINNIFIYVYYMWG